MAAIEIDNGYEVFTGLDGKPLNNGYIFIGQYGLNPLTSPKQAYWDEDLSIPASNIRTTAGYPVYQGSPGRLYTDGSYSILVQDHCQRTVYTQLEAYEAPASEYGEAIGENDLLLLDSPNPASSEGVQPITFTAPFVKPTIDVDGVEYDRPYLAYPGRRGMRDVTEELENIILSDYSQFVDEANCDSELQEDGWFKVEATADLVSANTASTRYNYTAFTGGGAVYLLVKKGNGDYSQFSFGFSGGSVTVDWSAESVAVDSGLEGDTYFLDAEKTLLLVILKATSGNNFGDLRLYAERFAETTNGNYTYYREISVVDIDYYLNDYFEGVRPAGDITYSHEWDTQFTIECKVDCSGLESGVESVIVSNTQSSSNIGEFQLKWSTADKWTLFLYNDSGGFEGINSATLSVPTGIVNVKCVVDTLDKSNLALYIDGVSVASGSGSFSDTVTLNRDMFIGRNVDTGGNPLSYWNGLISEILYRPSIDTSTTHYALGEPWRDPNATYDYRGYKFDNKGNYGVKSLWTADGEIT